MPELPEVETVRRSLERLIAGQTIAVVEVREPRLRRPLAPDFVSALTGRAICQVGRRGKYLHLGLDNGQVWLVHLGMTGQLVVGKPDEASRPHDHILIVLGNGQCLRYNDTRRFGLMAVGSEEEIAALTGLGVEPLSPAFSTRYFWIKAQGTQRAVKDLLMDQRVVAGIGNIYASELLFHAGVRPARIASTLSRPAAERIVKAAKAVLREAIRHRGSSISDYLDGEGQPGNFQERFHVYGREGEPCRVCATPIQREIRGGRSAFFCPTCQQ
ncbi:MAG: bifunctional DNA-formamidopyrimidine glycosylase/DNA-(apurinic or apyrimidinic site) lyase [Deltaproteobacteria bacterium]|nr:bifunctional DNA-formamidopyrimidine glycosylase/DNA-(apurinic or apyrimidinic site) lyase [Deltaproteobacteria bacterium]